MSTESAKKSKKRVRISDVASVLREEPANTVSSRRRSVSDLIRAGVIKVAAKSEFGTSRRTARSGEAKISEIPQTTAAPAPAVESEAKRNVFSSERKPLGIKTKSKSKKAKITQAPQTFFAQPQHGLSTASSSTTNPVTTMVNPVPQTTLAAALRSDSAEQNATTKENGRSFPLDESQEEPPFLGAQPDRW